MKMLLYKAWIETRVRFVAGLIAVSIVCIYYINSHAMLVYYWTQDIQNPKGYHFEWQPLAVREYGWYIWHFLYDNYLQQVWGLFAVLFAFGGLIRERSGGTALFSLGLPVSRKRWLFSRLSVAVLESMAISLFAVVIIFAGSSIIHQSYSHTQVLLHAMLMVGAGLFLIALGNLCFTLFPGEYLSLILTIVVLGIPYLLLQGLMLNEDNALWLKSLNISHVMSGPWQMSWGEAPWLGLGVALLLTALLIGAAAKYGDRSDY